MGATFSVQVGKEKVWVHILQVDMICVTYKGKNCMIQPTEDGWRAIVDELDDKVLQRIGKAIERELEK